MRPIRVWLSAAVWGFALLATAGSSPPLQADEPRERERVRQDREDESRDRRDDERREREMEDRDHRDDDDDRDRDHADRDHKDRVDKDRDHRAGEDRADDDRDHKDHIDNDRDHGDRPRPHDADHRHDGPTAVRNSVNDELLDLARALRRIDQSYGFRGIQGCGAWTAGSAYRDWGASGYGHGFGNRPHPPMVHDPGLYEDRFSQGTYRDHYGCGCARPPRPLILGGCRDIGHEDDNCSLLTRRICTDCGHVYPRHEQPRCNCHGGEASHEPHRGPHPAPDHRPHDGPDREPTPVDRDHDRDHAPPPRR